MRDLLCVLDHPERIDAAPRDGAWVGRLEARVGQPGPDLEVGADDLVRRQALEDALAAGVVGRAEALEESLEGGMAVDGQAQHLVLDPAVEALGHAVGLRRVGPGPAVLHAEFSAGRLEVVGGEAAAAIGRPRG